MKTGWRKALGETFPEKSIEILFLELLENLLLFHNKDEQNPVKYHEKKWGKVGDPHPIHLHPGQSWLVDSSYSDISLVLMFAVNVARSKAPVTRVTLISPAYSITENNPTRPSETNLVNKINFPQYSINMGEAELL